MHTGNSEAMFWRKRNLLLSQITCMKDLTLPLPMEMRIQSILTGAHQNRNAYVPSRSLFINCIISMYQVGRAEMPTT